MTQTLDERQGSPIGIIDIGSNSVRLVVYDSLHRMPLPLFNEKAVCALGQGLEKTNGLNPKGVTLAFSAIGRFVRLARAMKVQHLHVLATAAVRDAIDGVAFVAALEQRYQISVQVLQGVEEAELAALGVLCAVPDAHGLVADLGGGSLELVTVADGRPGYSSTLPLGVLRLADAVGGDLAIAQTMIDCHLSLLDWLTAGHDFSLYAVGGAWRTLARLCIHQSGYPLHVLDNFTLPVSEAKMLIQTITGLNHKTLEKVPGLSSQRLPYLSLATLLLERLLVVVQPVRLVFSIYGMREGQFFKTMAPVLRREDPLIAACHHLARCTGRFPEHSDALMTWMSPLFPDEQDSERRLRRAACLLSNVFWSEHPDYRAEQAFLKILRLPLTGLNHHDRASLALAVYYRYKKACESDLVQQISPLLDDRKMRRAAIIGLTLRLVHTLTGGVADLLCQIRLSLDDNHLTLTLPEDEPAFIPGLYERRLHKLAQAIGYDAIVIYIRNSGNDRLNL